MKDIVGLNLLHATSLGWMTDGHVGYLAYLAM